MIMPSAYKTAVERASAAMAGAILDPSRGAAACDALMAALRVFVGDDAATAFPPAAVERVQRDVLVHFGDGHSARVRREVEQRFGTEVAEVVERLIVENIAEAIRQIADIRNSLPPPDESKQ
jgi:hypothetical protein